MQIEIHGYNLPGRRFVSDGRPLANVHVGVQVRKDPDHLVAGDAASAEWHVQARVSVDDSGGLDFHGPGVHGRHGERFLYITWGNVETDGSFTMFRRAKLMLGRIEPKLIRAAEQTERPLVGRVDLTDDWGAPRCARVNPPALTWTVD